MGKWFCLFCFRIQSRIFEIVFAQKSPNIKLWLARYQNKAIAGQICLYSENQTIAWHASSLSEYLHLRPMHLLQYEIIKDAHNQKYWWYDFMDSGGCAEGVAKFKQNFATIELSCPWLARQNSLITSLQSIKTGCKQILKLNSQGTV